MSGRSPEMESRQMETQPVVDRVHRTGGRAAPAEEVEPEAAMPTRPSSHTSCVLAHVKRGGPSNEERGIIIPRGDRMVLQG